MEWVHTEDDVYQKTMTVKELAGEVIKERMQKNLVPEKDDSALLGSIGDEVRFVFPPCPQGKCYVEIVGTSDLRYPLFSLDDTPQKMFFFGIRNSRPTSPPTL